MFPATSNQHRAHGRRFVRLTLSALLAASCMAVWPGSALSAPFKLGDVFLAPGGTSSVSEYSPAGRLVQTLPGTSGAKVVCFDPSGRHLILPGVGLFDSSGNWLPSNWASVTNAGRCVADGSGHVYVSSCPAAGCNSNLGRYGIITQYDIKGDALKTFSVDATGLPPIWMALAPGGCALYNGMYGEGPDPTGILNVCTGQTSTFSPNDLDDMLVLPNGDMLWAGDTEVELVGASFAGLRTYYPDPSCQQCVQDVMLSPDPDGTSFWVSTLPTDNDTVTRFDIATGRILAQWTGGGAMAVDPGVSAPPPPPHPFGPPGASGAPGGARGTGAASPSRSQVCKLLSAILIPRGHRARIGTLLAHGSYSFTWTTPSAGGFSISWREPSSGQNGERVQVALASETSVGPKQVKTTIVLTPAGKRLLRSVRRVRLVAKASFVPVGETANIVAKSFVLTR